jgi:hypothetical protein
MGRLRRLSPPKVRKPANVFRVDTYGLIGERFRQSLFFPEYLAYFEREK